MVDSKIAKQFGKIVRRLRLEQGLSQEVFAAKCGLHRTYIGPIERGEKNITLETASKLAQALKCNLSTIFIEIESE